MPPTARLEFRISEGNRTIARFDYVEDAILFAMTATRDTDRRLILRDAGRFMDAVYVGGTDIGRP